MSFDWVDFLAFARALQSDPTAPGPPEAAQRSAASRAYYAAFHRAISVGMEEGYTPYWSGEDHKRIQTHFRDFRTPDVTAKQAHQKVATQLDRLLDYRRKADYVDSSTMTSRALADAAVRMADVLILALEAIAQSKAAAP